jgi:hypothetical protein
MAILTQTQINDIKELYQKYSYLNNWSKISKIIGIPRNTLVDLCKRNFKERLSPHKITSEESNLIIKLWEEGNDPAKISRLMNNRNMSSIRNLLISKGIYHDKRLIQENPFIDNPESWYWIGYIVTDGYLKKNSYNITLSQSGNNLGHLKKYAAFLGNNIKVKNNPNYGRNRDVVSFSNKESYIYLNSLGIFNKKSNNIELTCPINVDLLRGIFDGDGSISTNYIIKITSGSILLLNQIMYFLNLNEINFKLNADKSNKNKINHNPCYDLMIPKKNGNIQKFYNLLYYENCVCLERKRLKFQEYFEKQAELKSRNKAGKPRSGQPEPKSALSVPRGNA